MGLLHLHDDIPVSLADEVIESLQVRGMFIASDEVKAVLSTRMK
jgi:Ribbon-Helix-Helix transcriptional regulator family